MSPPIGRTDPAFLAVARDDAPADLAIDNACVLNVFTRSVEPASIAICGGRVARVADRVEARERVDARGAFATPGLIDAHMHVESTMLMPREFAALASARGTTAAVLDPHEIANVLGLPGVRLLMDDAAGAPIHALWMASSCVPASHLETSGATLTAADIAGLLDDPRVLGLAEMMNFPGVVHANPEVLEKVRLGLARGIVDGHAPGLVGPPLDAYAGAGIGSDHECVTAEEARAKVARGLRVYIREGSAARNLEALLPAVTPETVSRFCFCTDDRHPRDLADEGHIDHVVRRAIALGLDPVAAVVMATLNPAEHYRQPDLGAIAPGRLADILLVDDLRDFRPRSVYFGGRLVASEGRALDAPDRSGRPASAGAVRLPRDFGVGSLRVPARSPSPTIRVIGMDPHQLVTESRELPGVVRAGEIVADPARDILKLAVIDRHSGRGSIGLGFIQGFRLPRGALASTIGHDSHNLAVVGADDESMVAAARALERCAGGQAVASGGEVLALLPLPIAGLISPLPAGELIELQTALLGAAQALGCPIHDPFMPLSFMPLAVIPHLKLTDRGLVDVDAFDFVPLEAGGPAQNSSNA